MLNTVCLKRSWIAGNCKTHEDPPLTCCVSYTVSLGFCYWSLSRYTTWGYTNFQSQKKCLPGGGPPNFLCPFCWTMLYPVFSIRASKAAPFWAPLRILLHPLAAALFSSCISATASTEYRKYSHSANSKLLHAYRSYQNTEKPLRLYFPIYLNFV